MSFYKLYPRNLDAEEKLVNELGISRMLARLFTNRGIIDPEEGRKFLEGDLSDLQSPWDLKGMDEAVSLVAKNIRQKEPILIHGDYDADGITGTALLMGFLKEAGATADYYIPHRVEEGYGLSVKGLEKGKQFGASLVLTVDCGCGSPNEVELANRMGMTVVVTDHHMVGDEMPAGAVIVNPQQPGCSYKFKELSGVGVAYRFICALAEELGTKVRQESFLDLVAIGSVGDVVPLISENRILVREGLARINSHARPGLMALLIRARIKEGSLSSRDISFGIAPRLNSAGRLKSADLSVDLLMAGPDNADALAEKLEELNRRRQNIEEKIRHEITGLLSRQPSLLENNHLLMSSYDWHPGVIGLTAGRLADTFRMPVFLVAFKEDGTGRGSARTKSGPDIFGVLRDCSPLLDSYGGHPRAGGFQVNKEKLPEFEACLDKIYNEAGDFEPDKVLLDAELSLDDVNESLYRDIKLLAPFGEGNSEPRFLLRGVRWDNVDTVGNGKHLRGFVSNGGSRVKALGFGQSERMDEIEPGSIYDLAVTVDEDKWQGNSCLYLKVRDFGSFKAGVENGGIIDVRGIGEKIAYIGNVVSQARGSAVLVRIMKQADYWKERLNGIPGIKISGVSRDKTGTQGVLYVHSYMDLPDDLEAEEILLLYPPPSLDHFRHSLYKNSPRVHLLFGEQETRWEELFQSVIFPSEEDLRRIHERSTEEFNNRKFRRSEFLEIQKHFPDRNIKAATMEAAIRVFMELGVITDCGDGMYNMARIEYCRFEDSSIFESFKTQRKAFEYVKKMLPPGGRLESLDLIMEVGS
ncbi:MAG: single-stranded-DNA-specific exonuclease RecJ [Chloroflexi bacterium]|nr:single-stranded-DNA-specific exonuclease RecJ [Chloroflexota bacterium]